MADEREGTEKPKGSILGILKLVATILAVLVFLLNTVTNLVVAYMIFAPDDFPKPFYIYTADKPGIAGEAASTEPGGTTEGGSTPAAGHSTGGTTEGGATSEGSTTEGGTHSMGGTYLPGQGVILDTGNKIVNLNEPGGRKYIRTNVVLEFAPNQDFDALEGEAKTEAMNEFKAELNGILPVINDVIITLLSSKNFEAVSTSEGKEVLRQQIMEAVNSRVHEFEVIYVYFTEFVYQ